MHHTSDLWNVEWKEGRPVVSAHSLEVEGDNYLGPITVSIRQPPCMAKLSVERRDEFLLWAGTNI
jgi:hypothetical protein